jgi:hypothetical protein
MQLRWTCLGLACLSACATASFDGTPIAEWAGAYGSEEAIIRDMPPTTSGRPSFIPLPVGYVEQILEVRPTGPTQALVDFRLLYPRGHQCNVAAPADLRDGRLVLHANPDEGTCQIIVSREKNREGEDVLDVWIDRDASNNCYAYCGANARLTASIPISSRHALPKTPATQVEE